MDLWGRLEETSARWNVLEHPFYVRWSRGELSREELAAYAAQYRHAVVALARGAAAAARCAPPELRDELSRHAAEEAAHVALWDGFAAAAGAIPAPPEPGSAACAATWEGGPELTLLERLAGLYAIEAAQPEISRVKAQGLVELYGFERGSATAYFDLHAELDREHAAAGRARIARLVDGADAEALVARAEAVLKANWELLDGVQSAG